MRIAISNIAWNVPEDVQVAALLDRYRIDAIDLAPGKYFPDPLNAQPADIARVKAWWGDRGIGITGMQSLLFGTTGLNLFGTDTSRDGMLTHLEAVCRIGAGLGAKKLVFGSPKNRDRSGLSSDEANAAAISFFTRLSHIAERHGVTICLEPNPPCYGANFMIDSAETAAIVMAVADPSIRMQLDTGALAINHEDPKQIIQRYAMLIGHIHVSEPDLVTLGDGGVDHVAIAREVKAFLSNQVVTIEMLPAKNESNITAIERAIGVAIRNYGDTDAKMGASR